MLKYSNCTVRLKIFGVDNMSRRLLKKSIIYIFEMCLTISTHSLLIASSVCYEQSSHSLGFNGTITTAILVYYNVCHCQHFSCQTGTVGLVSRVMS